MPRIIIIGTGLPRRIVPRVTPARSGVGGHLHVGTVGLSGSATLTTGGGR
ncbi:hypothetical protein DVS28_b0156 (plasmid) [Euzebya pacifica]|uniref:Uncharacterized protein n=1 Tax=Euzebya pacifica TaxID=1608957 RepID=A0A346Y629_9ACTN|nr:hypothetical protein [Euzebya pacifica]AXV09926.1 hypothetical protein DVS28_b0156 [Euzebya pacifica]